MKEINAYIIEKLNLTKDIHINRQQELKKGDKIFCVSLDYYFKEYTLKLYDPFTFIEIKNNSIRYNTKYPADQENGKNMSHIFDINSNGYYEIKKSNTTALIMTSEDAVDFLKDILDNNVTPKLLFKYFDEEDEFINDAPIIEGFNNKIIKDLIIQFSK